ncbi:sialate O-acetylesterase, partial [bacterium]|nr:sialate O-acetylesterase [bacterium]
AMSHAGSEIPALKDVRMELAGFIWFQGWNDMFDEQARADYASNLVCLVSDFRKAFNVPELPVVIGETGNLGTEAGQNMVAIREAQEKAAETIEPAGSASFVSTTDFARPKELSPNVGHGHHWFGNAESYFLIGDAMGEEMIRLLPISTSN